MKRFLAAAAVGLCVPVITGFALAQGTKAPPAPNTATSGETVVVTAPRPSREEREKAVWNFVYAHAKLAPKIDQLSRWTAPVCPEVQNLPPAYATFIVNRIKTVAKTVGAPVSESCRTNIEIIFDPDPQALLDRIADKNPKLLGYHFIHNTKEVAKVTRPIQAWYVTATSNRMQTAVDDPYHAAPAGTPGSRLSNGQLSVFANILIVARADTVAGQPVGQIAAYLAMPSLSMADAPDSCVELPSVLELLSPDCSQKAQQITESDKSYLTGLYAMDPEEIGSLQKSAIANRMKQDSRPK